MSPFEIKHHIFFHVESYCKGSSLCDQCEFATEPDCSHTGLVPTAKDFFDKTYFYSDSINDLPLFLEVDEPRVVNPGPKLLKEAQSRSWPVEYFWSYFFAVTVGNIFWESQMMLMSQ